jgi:hypothetical protein
MKDLFSHHKGFWTPQNKRSLYVGFLLLALALVVQVRAGSYSARRAQTANFAGDLFLDNLPVVDLNFVILQGALLLFFIASALFILRPNYALFGVKAVAIFIITRSFFVDLTHIGIYPEYSFYPEGVGAGVYNLFSFNGNFFFSGHTGMPFLLAIIFWREKFWRYFFLAVSILFGASVLLAHAHYSIDVFAAPFITYSIFRISAWLFPRDYALSLGSHHQHLT